MNTLKAIVALAISAQAAQLSAETQDFKADTAEEFYNTNTLNDMEDDIFGFFNSAEEADDTAEGEISTIMSALQEKLEAAQGARASAWSTFEETATAIFDDLDQDLKYTALTDRHDVPTIRGDWDPGNFPKHWQKN